MFSIAQVDCGQFDLDVRCLHILKTLFQLLLFLSLLLSFPPTGVEVIIIIIIIIIIIPIT